jgi:hypothetical protein
MKWKAISYQEGQSIERGERFNIDFHYAPIENLSLLWRINNLKPFKGILGLALYLRQCFVIVRLKKV